MNSSPMFGNSYAPHDASPYPEPLYNIRTGPNSLVNLPCCNSPQGSSFSNFSPGRRTPDVISSRSFSFLDHGLTNPTMNSSPMFGNRYAHAASPYTEPLYNIRSGPNSLVNLDCCNSPQGSSFSNFSPGRRTPDVISSRNLRYQPYNPLPAFYPYPGDIEFRRHATNLFAKDGGKEVNGKWLNSKLNRQRNIKMHPTTGKERYDGITEKTTARRKEGIKHSKNKNIYKGKVSAQSIDNNLQMNYYHQNIIPNHVRNRVMLGNVSAQSIDNNLQTNYNPNAVLNNVPNQVMDKNNFSPQSISKNPPTNYNPNVVPSNAPSTVTSQRKFSAQSIDNNPPTNYYDPNTVSYHVPSNVMPKGNFPAQRTDNYPHTNYNPNVNVNCTEVQSEVSVSNKEANQCNQQCSMANEQNHTDGKYYTHVQVIEGNIDKTKTSAVNSTVTEETNFITCAVKYTGFNTLPQNDLFQGIFASTVQSATDVNDTQSLNSLDLSDYNLTHVTIPENSSFNIEDIHQETMENADSSNYSFEPIFEGKDKNGENALLVNSSVVSSSAQKVDEGENGAFVDNQNSEIRKDRAVLNNISGHGPAKKKYDFSNAEPELLKDLVVSEVEKHSLDSLRGTTVGTIFHILESSKNVNILEKGPFCLDVLRNKVTSGEFIYSNNWLRLPNHKRRYEIEKKRRAERIAREKLSRFNHSETNQHVTKATKRGSSKTFPHDVKKIRRF